MSTPGKPNSDDEALRFENEFLKAKIMAEHGALNVHLLMGDDASPEEENEFLKAFAAHDETL